MQALSFSFENNAVRTLGTADLPLFVAIDVATALGYKNTKDAVLRHVDSDDLIKSEIADKLNRIQTVNCVNESGLYALIFGSKLESAKRFFCCLVHGVVKRDPIHKGGSKTHTPLKGCPVSGPPL